jgi:hypothetical protein
MRLKYPKTDPMNYIAKILMNSSYGRFGMDDRFDEIRIMNEKDYKKFEKKYINFINDIIILDNKYLVKIKNQDDLNNFLDNGSLNHNINIAIAAAITSYARIEMSQYKNNPNYKLYYTDTDSIYINKPLPDSMVSEMELGKMKLEFISNKAIFLAPKVYGYLTKTNEEIIKIKGLTKETIKNNITLENLKQLLIKDNKLEAKQTKWFKSLTEGQINLKEQIYSLKVTGNKNKRVVIATTFKNINII